MERKECYLLTNEPDSFPVSLGKVIKFVPSIPELNFSNGEELYVDLLHFSSVSKEIQEWNSRVGPVYLITRIPINASKSYLRGLDNFEIIPIESLEKRIRENINPEINMLEAVSGNLPDIPENGSFNQNTWGNILSSLHLRKVSGTLYIKTEKIKKSISFYQGIPVEIKSNKVKELLGRLLVDEGLITSEQCEESLSLMRTEKILQGQALVELNLLNSQELEEALSRQWAIKLVDIFTWGESEYQFREEKTLPPERTFPFTFMELIQAGLNILPRGIVKSSMARLGEYYLIPNPDPYLRFQPLPSNSDLSSLTGIDGKVKLKDLIKNIHEEKTMTLLCALLLSGFFILSKNPSDIPIPFTGFPVPGEILDNGQNTIANLENEWHSSEIENERVEYWLRKIHFDRFISEGDILMEQSDLWFKKLIEKRVFPSTHLRGLRFFKLGWKD
ncbi:MAG: DUF4388 domain-containing protein [Deltaproteobacteria bacterium]|nr:DUF4388 domain-containing protein [Deltaproteobacteria bacterium]